MRRYFCGMLRLWASAKKRHKSGRGAPFVGREIGVVFMYARVGGWTGGFHRSIVSRKLTVEPYFLIDFQFFFAFINDDM